MAHGYPSKSKIRSYFIKPFMMNKTTFHTGTKGLADLWVDAMYAKSERSTTGAASVVSVRAGRVVSLADMDIAEAQKELDLILIIRRVSSASSGCGESPASARGAPAVSAATTTSESVSAEFTRGSQPPTGVGAKRARRARSSAQAPGVGTIGGGGTNTTRVNRMVVGPYLSDGIVRRARRWAWVLRGPAGLPPRDGNLVGFHAPPPPPKAPLRPQSKRQGQGTGAGSSEGGGGVSWKCAQRE